MSFVQVEFLGFLAVALALWWWLPGRRLQNAWLVVASAVFYGWVHPWFVLLLAYSVLLDWSVALGMARWPSRRRVLLALSIAGNLGLLGAFKYFDFFMESIGAALAALGLHPGLPVLGVMLPVGISFFTFQSMSYTIDVYRGRLEPRRSLLDFAAFVAMFPQLVAGPVERARNLLPQLERERTWDRARFVDGAGLALWGAVKKVVVADSIGLYVDRVFGMAEPNALLIWAATLGFAVQILADFGGYTDMARGFGRMMGIELMENFDRPYAAATPGEFWRRWHISFSSWIHEYLYVPLGGSRHGRLRTALATASALLLSGLWHGAAWHFVLWGAYHAALILVCREVQRLVPASWAPARPAAVMLMFGFTLFGWLIFRAPDATALAGYLWLPPLGGTWIQWLAASVVATVACTGGALLWLGGWVRDRWPAPPLPVRTTMWAAGVVALALFSRDTSRDFIYFQF